MCQIKKKKKSTSTYRGERERKWIGGLSPAKREAARRHENPTTTDAGSGGW